MPPLNKKHCFSLLTGSFYSQVHPTQHTKSECICLPHDFPSDQLDGLVFSKKVFVMYTCCTHPDHNSSTSVVLSLSPKILPFTIFSCIDIRHKEILFGYNKLEHYMPQLLCLAVLTAGCITFYLKSHIASGMSAGEWNNRGKTGHLLCWQELWLQSSSPALSLAQGQHKTLQRSGADDKAWLDTALSSVPSFSGQGRGKG